MVRDSRFSHVLKTPVHFTEQYIKEFLKEASFLFRIRHPMNSFLFDATDTKKISLMGLVLIYKFLEYSVQNQKFFKPVIRIGNYVDVEITKYGFHDLFMHLLSRSRKGMTSSSLLRHKKCS